MRSGDRSAVEGVESAEDVGAGVEDVEGVGVEEIAALEGSRQEQATLRLRLRRPAPRRG